MLTHPQFDPIALSLGPIAIRWYGLMYVIAFALFWWLGRSRIKAFPERGFTMQMLDDLLFFGVLGVILGGRLGYIIFYKPGYYLANPLEILYVWQGGMSFHGGFLGVLVAMILIARKYKMPWLKITDFIAPLVPTGLAAGRMGNFINGELPGRIVEARRDSVGDVVSAGGSRAHAAPSVAALPVLPGRAGAVLHSLVVLEEAASGGCGVSGVPDRLWRIPLHRRVRP